MSADVVEARRRFRQSLFDAGLWFDTGVPGVVGTSGSKLLMRRRTRSSSRSGR